MDKDEARIVEQLLNDDKSFRRLHDKHQRLDAEIERACHARGGPDDLVLGRLKRQKLEAKDLMAARVAEARRVPA